MRIESVPDVRPRAEGETFRRAALGDARAIHGKLLGAQTVLFAQVLRGVGAFGPHRRIQLERLEVHLDVAEIAADALERALERADADRTPRARDIRYHIDSHGWHLP